MSDVYIIYVGAIPASKHRKSKPELAHVGGDHPPSLMRHGAWDDVLRKLQERTTYTAARQRDRPGGRGVSDDGRCQMKMHMPMPEREARHPRLETRLEIHRDCGERRPGLPAAELSTTAPRRATRLSPASARPCGSAMRLCRAARPCPPRRVGSRARARHARAALQHSWLQRGRLQRSAADCSAAQLS